MSIRVLVVDDDQDILLMLSMTLRELGLDVVTAPDAETAHAIFHGYLPDVVLLDIVMPRIDGFELLKEWRDEGIETPVLLYTGYDTEEARVRAVASGACELVLKPAPPEVLASMLKTAADEGELVSS